MRMKCKFHNLSDSNKNYKALIIFTLLVLIILLTGIVSFFTLMINSFKHKDILIIFIICISGGAFGGYVDLYRGTENFSGKNIKEKIITGIACGFLVPLLLNTISSTLLKDSKNNPQNYYVFLGIVIISSIFSNDFLNMMKSKIIERDERIKELEKKVSILTTDRNKEEELYNSSQKFETPDISAPSPELDSILSNSSTGGNQND